LIMLTGVDLGGGRTFAQIDLADTHTLGAVADTVVDSALSTGLGTAGELVAALRVLLGLRVAQPSLDLARFASAPGAALAGYYQALLSTQAGWHDLLTAGWRLLGGTGTPPAPDGSGTRLNPWRLPLTAFTGPAGARPALSLAVWNDTEDTTDTTVRLRLGLRVDVASAPPAGGPGGGPGGGGP